jgi:LmbE family N-acetylglucosaminyl deacetylase
VLVVTAHAQDYPSGASGRLAKLIGEEHSVHVVQVTNDEKNFDGLDPAEARKANAE